MRKILILSAALLAGSVSVAFADIEETKADIYPWLAGKQQQAPAAQFHAPRQLPTGGSFGDSW